MRLKVKDCRIVALDIYPGDGGTTQVLEVVGTLTPPIARKLQIAEGCYNEDGIPRNYASFPSSALRINGSEVILGDKEFLSTMIHKFSVKSPKAKKQQGVSLDLHFRMHFIGKEPLKFWVDDMNKETFMTNISARQEDLAFGEKEADEEDTSVESSTADEAESEPEESAEEAAPLLHAAESEGEEVATLPPAVLAGGTHQRGTRRFQRVRNPDTEAPADDSGPNPGNSLIQ